MQAYLVTIVCKFGGDPAMCLREEAICAKVYRQTDGRTDDGLHAIALAHSWNELKITIEKCRIGSELEVLREHRPPPNASIIELLNDFCNAN